MRIVSYNILDGGEGRADPLAEVIEAQRPDVVALVEAVDLAVIERIASRLRFDFMQAPARRRRRRCSPDGPSAIRSTTPLIEPSIEQILARSARYRAVGLEWTFGVVHLHAHAAEEDEIESRSGAGRTCSMSSTAIDAEPPHILCGDFNANSPIQKIDSRKCKKARKKRGRENGGKHAASRRRSKLLDAGYPRHTARRRAAIRDNAGTFSTQLPGQRVDYIFTHGVATSIHPRPGSSRIASPNTPAIISHRPRNW